MAKALLEKAGFEVEVKSGLVRKSLEQGEIDFYYEYTGTAYTTFFKQKDATDMQELNKHVDVGHEAEAKVAQDWLKSKALLK